MNFLIHKTTIERKAGLKTCRDQEGVKGAFAR